MLLLSELCKQILLFINKQFVYIIHKNCSVLDKMLYLHNRFVFIVAVLKIYLYFNPVNNNAHFSEAYLEPRTTFLIF